MTAKFNPSDFPSRVEYEKHLVKLERAQTLAGRILLVMNDAYNFTDYGTQIYSAMLDMAHDFVMLGYEAAIGKPHKSSDYGINAAVLNGHEDACWFCKHSYYVYGCEENCDRKNKNLGCKLEVKEYLA